MKTKKITKKDFTKKWLILDASDQSLGRLSSEASRLLCGKHKPNYVPHLQCGDGVIIINARKIKLTGNKLSNKTYHRHSGYIGGLKSIKAKEIFNSDASKLITLAVKGMLAKNKLRAPLMKNLKIYAHSQHPHHPQKPINAPPRLAIN